MFTSVGRAGRCSPEVGRVQAEVDGYLEARASAGPYAEETRGALMNPEPTPASIAAAEEAVGDLDAARRLRMLARAREPDQAGDTSACEQALADAEHAIGPRTIVTR